MIDKQVVFTYYKFTRYKPFYEIDTRLIENGSSLRTFYNVVNLAVRRSAGGKVDCKLLAVCIIYANAFNIAI